MTRPKSYTERTKSCGNCKHCLHFSNYEYIEHYCLQDGTTMPFDFKIINRPMTEDEFETQHEWELDHVVKRNAVCDEWEEKE